MRMLLAVSLVLVLASCPILCGTAWAGAIEPCCAEESPRGHDDAPAPPAEGDDCLCHGALKGSDPTSLGTALGLFPSPSIVSLSPSPPTLGLAWSLTSKSAPYSPGRLRALLQSYRC